jgi:anti-anti-sigma factor
MAEDTESAARADRRAVVTFPDHVDASNAAQIREQLLAAFSRGTAVVIADMSATASCDHAGVDAVARAYQQAAVRRAALRLVAPASAVRRLLSGFICIEPEGYAADDALASWVRRGLDFVSGLPAKPVRANS